MPDRRPSPSRRRRRLYEPPPAETPEAAVPAGAETAAAEDTASAAHGADARAADAATDAGAPADAGARRDAGAPGTVTVVSVSAGPLVGKHVAASRIVTNYVGWAAGVGWLPFPFIGAAAVVAVQLKMLSELAALYGVPFSRERGRALIAAIGGGAGAVEISKPVLAPLLAAVVPLGWPVVSAAASTAASASTYAIGRVFVHHFELGGTLLSFRPEETRAYFAAERARGEAGPPPVDAR
jgi:uncharacterized protein (DUF697 family)